MAETTDILTFDEAQQAINMVGSGATHGFELEMWVSAISEAIDDACGPVVVRTITDETHYVDGENVLYLRHTPVSTVTTVTEYRSGTGTPVTAEAVGVAGGYLLHNDTLTRRSSWSTSSWFGIVTVSYTAGRYATTDDVAAKFKLAAASILRRLWARESAAWSRGGDVFGTEPTIGFFKAVDPMITEFLGDELKPPALA